MIDSLQLASDEVNDAYDAQNFTVAVASPENPTSEVNEIVDVQELDEFKE